MTATRALARVGALALDSVAGVGEVTLLAARSATSRPRIRAVVYQVYVQGVRALGLAIAASLFGGMAIAVQFGTGLSRFGALALLSQLTVLGLVRELVPVFGGLVVGARLGAGIAAELGSMAVTEQLDAVRVLGADPVRELVVPRVIAAVVVLPLITIFGDVVAAAGGMLVAALEYHIGPRYFIDSLRGFITVPDFLSGIAKSAGFGLMVALIACWNGLNASGGTQGVGRATTRTVVQGALAVIIADYFLSRLLLSWLSTAP
jgi:phospholipid/cholesterol/gamma-HCH transport system permease protein